VDLFWGAGPIPDGVRIMITGVEVKGKNGADIHEASGVSCQPPCHDYMFAAGGSCQSPSDGRRTIRRMISSELSGLAANA
jgi:hypothetical protein